MDTYASLVSCLPMNIRGVHQTERMPLLYHKQCASVLYVRTHQMQMDGTVEMLLELFAVLLTYHANTCVTLSIWLRFYGACCVAPVIVLGVSPIFVAAALPTSCFSVETGCNKSRIFPTTQLAQNQDQHRSRLGHLLKVVLAQSHKQLPYITTSYCAHSMIRSISE